LLSRQIRHEQLEALSLRALGDARSAMGRPQEAGEHWQPALALLTSLGCEALAFGVRERLEANSPEPAPSGPA
jgi:hypothetical protein